MLPEFPKLQNDMANRMREFVIARTRHYLAGLVEVPWTTIFEGHGNAITRADGVREETDMTLASSEFAIPFDEFPRLTFEDLASKYDGMAKHFAQQQAEAMFAAISKGAASVGNTVDGKGQPLTADLYLEVIGKIQIDFDENSQALFPTLHIGPAMQETAKQVIGSIFTDPTLNRRFEKIMQRQLGDWRAREARRELAG